MKTSSAYLTYQRSIMMARVATLRAVLDQRGILFPIDTGFLDDIQADDTLSDEEKLQLVANYHDALHEVLYAPPGKR